MATEFEETREFAAVDLPRLVPGSILAGRYRLVDELGRGGMGIVFRAVDEKLEREVAVKVLPEAGSTPATRERLLREARAAAALNHPGIVAVHDVGEHFGVPFFVMELVAGTSLHDKRPTELSEIVRIACAICDALEHAHAHGVVHRDLKPDNVLMATGATSGVIKLADLGVAAHASASHRITDSAAIVGTVSYMAPEQALGEPVDGRADLYALGVVLYELVTGKLPFTGARPLEVISKHVHAPVVPPRVLRPGIPLGLDAVIVKLLAKRPAQRFANAAETREALRGSLTHSVGSPEAPTAVKILEALSRGKLVGREAELGEARELWRRARGGTGHCLLISGEPGAGKTRLARELMIQAALDGALVLSGACYEYEAATPYLPFAQAFRPLVRDTDDETLRALLGDAAPRLARLAPEIASRLGPFGELQELAPHEERLLFFDAVVAVLSNAARARGVCFYIDDLHWSDSSSLWLLAHLLRRLGGERVLFVASYREVELDRAHPLSAALVDWNRERLTTRITLKRFGPQQTRDQLGALLGEAVPADFADAVHRETEGNPFFVEEVLKALIEQGSVRRESGRWRRDEVEGLAIPQSVKAAVGHRLDRVSTETNEVLRAAAVLGKSFDFKELVEVAGERGEEALLDAVDAAVCAQLLVSGRDESFSFTHDKIREVLYEELNPIRRRRLHRRTAEGLERLREARSIPAEKLAHHFVEAGEHERGLFWAKLAGDDACGVFAYDEAIHAYSQASECAHALGRVGEQADVEESAGKACMISGNLVAALDHFERALAVTTDPIASARLQTEAASSLVTTGDPRGIGYVHAALAVLDPATHPIEVATAMMIQARFHHLAGRHRQAAEILERAFPLATPRPGETNLSALHASTLTQLHAYSAGAYQHLALYEVSNGWAQRAVDFGKAYNVLLAQAVGYEFMGENNTNAGNWDLAVENGRQEQAIAGRLHARERMAWAHMYSGLALTMRGDLAEGEEELASGMSLAEAIGEKRVAILLAMYTALNLALRGDLDEGERAASAAVERAEASKLPYMRTEAARVYGVILARRGRLEEAVRQFERVFEITEGTDASVVRLWASPDLIEALLALGRRDEAKARFAEFEALVARCETPRFTAEVERLRDLI
jgi:tetratricopeptide (TPR) repeat protein